MGYTTKFTGKFKFNKPLDIDIFDFLTKFSKTRRMARNVDPKYGVEGEFYVEESSMYEKAYGGNIIDPNTPPKTQPGLWCQWRPSKCGKYIKWDGAEKFYNYIEWLEYIMKNFLVPKGYLLSGVVWWEGEDREDIGTIQAIGKSILVKEGAHLESIRSTSVEAILQLSKKRKKVCSKKAI